MSRRHVLFVALAVTVLAACETIRPLPIGAPSEAESALGAFQKLSADEPLPSVLLTPARMCQVTRQLLSDCDRARTLRSPEHEVVVGYRPGETEPAAAVSLSRIGSGDAQILVAVAVREKEGSRRVADVLTFSSGGDLYEMPAYERGKEKFLRKFPGRPADDAFDGIDAVTGATAITNALTKAIRTEAQALDALLAEPPTSAAPQG